MKLSFLLPCICAALLSACAPMRIAVAPAVATPAQLADATRAGVDAAMLATILNKQIYQMTPVEAGRYIAYIHEAEPDFRRRVAAIGRKNIGQPYSLNLLGEFPYEVHDDLPLFSLTHGDCIVFAEHSYAMAMSRSWEEFFWVLQSIRYKNGVIGVATRNHYTETDWNVSNRWLVTDISAQLAGAEAGGYDMKVDRATFLKSRHKTVSDAAVELSRQSYVPRDMVKAILDQLDNGDFVNVISTANGEYWASHAGLVVVGADGTRNFLNSGEPVAHEESFDAFIARTLEREQRYAAQGKKGKKLAGFKFLRLNEAPQVPPMLAQPRPASPLPRP